MLLYKTSIHDVNQESIKGIAKRNLGDETYLEPPGGHCGCQRTGRVVGMGKEELPEPVLGASLGGLGNPDHPRQVALRHTWKEGRREGRGKQGRKEENPVVAQGVKAPSCFCDDIFGFLAWLRIPCCCKLLCRFQMQMDQALPVAVV